MKKHLFLFALFGFFISSCWKTEDNPIHINKFTCKVNGIYWEAVPLQRDILGNDLQINKLPFSDIFTIHARNVKKDQSMSIDFSVNDSVKTSVNRLETPFADYSRNCNVYHMDTLLSHITTITEHDKVKRIVKGTFSFRAINSSTGCIDTATITDGFFDMQY